MPLQKYTGTWWKPDAPDDQFPGTLTISAEGEATLDLLGGFPLMVWERTGEGSYAYAGDRLRLPIVHGNSEGNDITLLDCRESDAVYPWTSTGPRAQQLSSYRTIVGVHLQGVSDAIFIAAKLRIENLQQWLGLGNISHTFDEDGKIRRAEINMPEPLSVEVDGVTIRASMYSSTFGFDVRRGEMNVSAKTSTTLEIRSSVPLTHDGFNEIAMAMGDLLTLASGEACAILSYSLELEKKRIVELPDVQKDGSIAARTIERTVTATVHSPRIADPQPEEKPIIPKQRFLFTCADMNFDMLIPAWLSLYQRLKPATDILFSLTYGPPRFIQVQALTAGVALEAMHRFLYPEALTMLPYDFEQLRNAALSGLVDPEDRERLQKTMRNEPTYKQRIEELASIPDKAAVVSIIPDIKKWASKQTRIRNGIAHALDDKAGGDVTDMFITYERARKLLYLILMHELGLPAAVQVRSMERNEYLSK
ncbi:HEPN domain-containing protein [Nocardia sp. NPDC023852]|uniref:ApeA N-terminal domain 1-containing protein n=1 Tax=Nocardia sp. NPDC023852 TaxID=3154697 RepID=UPI0033FED380